MKSTDTYFFKDRMNLDETWIYHFDSEQKSPPFDGKFPFFSSPKKAKVTPSSGKIISCFLDFEGSLMTDHPENGQTVTGEYFSDLLIKYLCKLLEKLVENSIKGSSYYMKISMSTGHKWQFKQQCGCEILPHSAYSPDLARSHFFFLFPYKKITQRTPYP